MTPHRIMIAGRSEEYHRDLRLALELDGYEVHDIGLTSPEHAVLSDPHDALIIDSGPDGGVSICSALRATRAASDVGIIVIYREPDAVNPIDLLNAGADDYLRAPYVTSELCARIRALLRRAACAGTEKPAVVLDDRTINLKAHKIQGPGGRVSHLTPREFGVLQCLLLRPNTLRTHHSLAQSVWKRDGRGEVEYMRVVIRQLRRKLEPDPENPRYIVTERSAGYRFHIPSADAASSRAQ